MTRFIDTKMSFIPWLAYGKHEKLWKPKPFANKNADSIEPSLHWLHKTQSEHSSKCCNRGRTKNDAQKIEGSARLICRMLWATQSGLNWGDFLLWGHGYTVYNRWIGREDKKWIHEWALPFLPRGSVPNIRTGVLNDLEESSIMIDASICFFLRGFQFRYWGTC